MRNSVAVAFTMEKSHTDLDSFEFWMNLGREVKGEIVRMIATEIHAYWEHSLVFKGADVWAMLNGMKAFSAHMSEQEKKLSIAAPLLNAEAEATAGQAGSPSPIEAPAVELLEEKKDGGNDAETLSLLGIADETPNPETIDQAIVKAFADFGKSHRNGGHRQKYKQAIRNDTIRKLTIVEGKINPGLSATINNANFETLVSLNDLYSEKVAANFGGIVNHAGQNSAQRSSVEEAPEEKTKNNGPMPNVADYMFLR